MKLFQCIKGTKADQFLKMSGETGVIVTECPELFDGGWDHYCQLVTNQIKHPIVMFSKPTAIVMTDILSFEIRYGDNKFKRKNTIQLSCDIMDYNFWYYYKVSQKLDMFYFSVDSDVCGEDVYKNTIFVMKHEGGKFVDFWGALE